MCNIPDLVKVKDIHMPSTDGIFIPDVGRLLVLLDCLRDPPPGSNGQSEVCWFKLFSDLGYLFGCQNT